MKNIITLLESILPYLNKMWKDTKLQLVQQDFILNCIENAISCLKGQDYMNAKYYIVAAKLATSFDRFNDDEIYSHLTGLFVIVKDMVNYYEQTESKKNPYKAATCIDADHIYNLTLGRTYMVLGFYSQVGQQRVRVDNFWDAHFVNILNDRGYSIFPSISRFNFL